MYQVYGPYQKINRFIPLLINTFLKKIQFPTSHGRQKRDFLYVDDAISAILKALHNKESDGKIINIGSGKPIQLLEVMKLVKKIIGEGKIILNKIKLRRDEPMVVYPNLDRARQILKWKSRLSFKKGLLKTIKFYKKKK